MTRVLIVDDDAQLLDGLRRRLRGYDPAWQFFFATSSHEALETLAHEDIDVLVFDMNMPTPDGAELSNITSDRYPELARIAMSGHYDPLTTYSLTSGPHYFIRKPFDPFYLIALIEKASPVRLRNQVFNDPRFKAELVPALPADERRKANRERLRVLGIRFPDD